MKVRIKGRDNFHVVMGVSSQTTGAWGAQKIEPVILVIDRETNKILVVSVEDVEQVDK